MYCHLSCQKIFTDKNKKLWLWLDFLKCVGLHHLHTTWLNPPYSWHALKIYTYIVLCVWCVCVCVYLAQKHNPPRQCWVSLHIIAAQLFLFSNTRPMYTTFLCYECMTNQTDRQTCSQEWNHNQPFKCTARAWRSNRGRLFKPFKTTLGLSGIYYDSKQTVGYEGLCVVL